MAPRIGWGQKCGDVSFINWGAAFKIAAISIVVISSLILLTDSRRNSLRLSVGPTLLPGKVTPQLISAGDLTVLLAPDGSLWCWGATDTPRTCLVDEQFGA